MYIFHVLTTLDIDKCYSKVQTTSLFQEGNLTEDDNENVEQNNSTNVEHLEEHEIFDVIPRRPIASEESDDEDENLNEHNEDGIENFNGHNEILV